MSTDDIILEEATSGEYKYGFTTNIEQEIAEKGLNEDVIRFISAKKNEPDWLLKYRLDAFHIWQKNGRAELGPCELSKTRLPSYKLLCCS
jgi:Fe-S cluster assembly protein SufB